MTERTDSLLSLAELRRLGEGGEISNVTSDGTEIVWCGEQDGEYVGWIPRDLAEAKGYAPERWGDEQLLALVEVAEAAKALVEDTANGGTQHVREGDCGDSGCRYASCKLARSLAKFSW